MLQLSVCMPWLKTLHAPTKTWSSQINKYINIEKKNKGFFMSRFQNTHITEAGYFGIPFPQSTPREIKSSFLGLVIRGAESGGWGRGNWGCQCLLYAYASVYHVSWLYFLSFQHSPVEAAPPVSQVMESYSHCSRFGPSDPHHLHPTKFLPLTGRKSFPLGPQIQVLFPVSGWLPSTSAVKRWLSHWPTSQQECEM